MKISVSCNFQFNYEVEISQADFKKLILPDETHLVRPKLIKDAALINRTIVGLLENSKTLSAGDIERTGTYFLDEEGEDLFDTE